MKSKNPKYAFPANTNTAINAFFDNYSRFDGRSSRSEYWRMVVVSLFVWLGVAIVYLFYFLFKVGTSIMSSSATASSTASSAASGSSTATAAAASGFLDNAKTASAELISNTVTTVHNVFVSVGAVMRTGSWQSLYKQVSSLGMLALIGLGFLLIVLLILAVPILSLHARRYRDAGFSPMFLLLPLLVFAIDLEARAIAANSGQTFWLMVPVVLMIAVAIFNVIVLAKPSQKSIPIEEDMIRVR